MLKAGVLRKTQFNQVYIMKDLTLKKREQNKVLMTERDTQKKQSFPMRFFLSLDLFLIQHVFETTRFRGDQTPSKLDYIYLNKEKLIENLKYDALSY